ncbi:hypothetical protein N7444_002049 [Penicillium canescens]|nr:hypothetical protein N7444_002049 [Penicillium canescens]KAJ6154953.1 hypothetical protein N7485_013322 [Penicillium canescens]
MTSISFGGENSGIQVGINHGPIYPPANQPEPRLKPVSTVPFPHDPDFASRDSIPGSRIVLVGLGGVGLGQSSPWLPLADFVTKISTCHRILPLSPTASVRHLGFLGSCE